MPYFNRDKAKFLIPLLLVVAWLSGNYIGSVLMLALIIPALLDVPDNSVPNFWLKRLSWYIAGNIITAIAFIWLDADRVGTMSPDRWGWLVISGGCIAWSLMYLYENLTRRMRQT